MALAGSGFGNSSEDSKSKESSSSAFPAMAAGEVAGDEGVDDPAELRPDPVGGDADHADRARPP